VREVARPGYSRAPGLPNRRLSRDTGTSRWHARTTNDESDVTRAVHLEATRLVNGERISVLGWGRAILMQIAHPLVAAGIADHSTFRGSALAPLWRLHATIGAMRAMSFGSEADARRAAAGINRIHDRVHGALGERAGRFDADARYSAHDPELLAWVHVTLLDSMPLVYDRFVAPLPEAVRDAYCRESVHGAALLGLPSALVPQSHTAVRATIDARLADGTLAVTTRARALADAILTPPLRRIAWPAARLHRLITVGLLPEALRAEYGFAWTANDDRALDRWSGRMRTLARVTPAALRRWPEARR
jgi:uncharacterized protein (DUF2236 family)